MAFGQNSGPPANHRQIEQLLALLHQAGHRDFRDARGPMGFSQRQAGGKFTVEEADTFIEQLEQTPFESQTPSVPAEAKRTTRQLALGKYSDQELAAELQSRGWIVLEP